MWSDVVRSVRSWRSPVSDGVSSRWVVLHRQLLMARYTPDVRYLDRLILVGTPWFRVMVHRLLAIDDDPHPHTHPWRFWSWTLKGRYVEERYSSLGAGAAQVVTVSSRFRRFDDLDSAHQIIQVDPGTVTLVVTGPKVQRWGFLVQGAIVGYREYLRLGPKR